MDEEKIIRKRKKTETKNKNLEESIEELNVIIQQLEKEDISLESSFQLYQEGMRLLKDCNESIDRVEKELQIIEENGMDVDNE